MKKLKEQIKLKENQCVSEVNKTETDFKNFR
jgi:hypothetical protein